MAFFRVSSGGTAGIPAGMHIYQDGYAGASATTFTKGTQMSVLSTVTANSQGWRMDIFNIKDMDISTITLSGNRVYLNAYGFVDDTLTLIGSLGGTYDLSNYGNIIFTASYKNDSTDRLYVTFN